MRTEAPESSCVDYEALAEFCYQLRKFLSFSETAAHKARLTPQNHRALLAIKGCSAAPVTIGAFADLLLVRHTAVALADRMATLGLLVGIAGENDSRRIIFKPTRKGENRNCSRSPRAVPRVPTPGERARWVGLTSADPGT